MWRIGKVLIVASLFMLAAISVSGEWVRPLLDSAELALLGANATPWTNTSTDIIPRTGFPDNVDIGTGQLTAGDLLPDANNTGNIGLEDQRWNHLYVQIANISELGGFSPIVVSTLIQANANITAPNYFGSGKFLTDIDANQSFFSNQSGNATFANSSSFSLNATFASAVSCSDILPSGNITDFCNRPPQFNQNDIDFEPFLRNDSMLFGNISELNSLIDSLNTTINSSNSTSTTDELQNVFTQVGSDSGNASVNSQESTVTIAGQAGGTSTSASGNVITIALAAVNTVITTFTNAVTFDNTVTVLADINTNGTVNGTFVGDGSGLTGITVNINDLNLEPLLRNDSMLFGNISELGDIINDVNTTQNIENLGFSVGNSSPWLTVGDVIYSDNTKFVGINNSNPLSPLHVIGDANITGNLSVGTGTLIITNEGILFPDDTFQPTAAVPPIAAGWNGTDKTKTFLLNSSARVGVGTQFPIQTVEIFGVTLGDSFESRNNNWSNVTIFQSQILDLAGFNISAINDTLSNLNATIIAVATIYNDTLLIQSVNTTANIEGLGFSTGLHTDVYELNLSMHNATLNISLLQNDILALNLSINATNSTSTTDELQNVFTQIGSDSGNASVYSLQSAATIAGQAGGTVTSASGNIITVALETINTVITSFTNEITFENGIVNNANYNSNGTLNASNFFGSGANLTGTDDGDWVVGDGILYNSSNGTLVGIGTSNPEGFIHVRTTEVITPTNISFQSFPTIAFYRFEEGNNGSTILDSSGNNINGTTFGTVTHQASKEANGTGNFSIRFAGVNDYIKATDNTNLVNLRKQNYSLTAWVNPSTANGDYQIFYKNNGSDDSIQLYLRKSGVSFAPAFAVEINKVMNRKQSVTLIPTNKWSHVAGIYNGTGILIYVNGVQVATGDSNANHKGADNDIYMGVKGDLSSDFEGRIDEVALINNTLNSSQVLTIYNDGLATANLTINVTSGGDKFIVTEQGHILVEGTDDISIFEGDVQIKGTLFGGSPVKVSGGFKVIEGDIQVSEGSLRVIDGITDFYSSVHVHDGNIDVKDNITAENSLIGAEFIDLTPAYDKNKTEALKEVKEIKKILKEDGTLVLNHSSLPDFVRRDVGFFGEDVEGRSLGAMVTVLVDALQALEEENALMRAELCVEKKYSWCPDDKDK